MAGLLNNMSNEEQDIFAQVLQETRQKKKDLSQSKQIREIVPIEKWISSPYYVGRDGAKLYDFWKEEMIDIFGENRGKYNEIVVTGCFIGSTEVPLLNGEIKTMEELADEYGFSKEFWVYSTDDEGNIVPGKARNARKTGKNKEVWYVELDNGEKVYCTPDHKFKLRDGNYVEAQNLEKEDSLMPLYRKYEKSGYWDRTQDGYERVYNPATESWEVTHKLVGGWKYGGVNYDRNEDDVGEVIHHKDFDKLNNSPDNLLKMGFYEHIKYHCRNNQRLWEDPEYVEMMKKVTSKTAKKTMEENWKDPVYREKMSNIMKERWENGDFDEHLEVLRKAQKEFMNSPEGKELAISNLQKIDMSEEEKEKWKNDISNTLKEKWENGDFDKEEVRQRIIRLNREENLAEKGGKASAKKKIKDFEDRTGLTLDVLLEELSNSNSVNSIAKKYEISNSTIYRKLKRNGYPSKADKLKDAGYLNHKVVNVGFSHYEDVYDFEVDKHHNFMIEPGINVHNSLGTGKSTFALFCMLRKLYELSCYENIAGLFDLMSTSFIVFIYFSVNRTQAELTGFGQFRELVDSIDYFQKEFARNEKLNSLLKFPENVLFTHGSSTEHAIGMNMIGAILDEANFFKGEERNPSKSTNQAYSQIAELYSSIVNRGKSRFMDKDEDHSLSILVSSATHSSSFTQKRIEMAANDPHTKIIDSKLWEVKPEKYSDETFWVFAGSELLDPYIIRDVTDVNKFFESIEMDMINPDYNSIEFAISKVPVQYQEHFVEVPVDFRKSFENELISALQDIAGVSIAPMGRLFTSRPTLNAACQRGMGKGLKHPFYKDEFEVPTNSDIKVQDFLRDGFVFKNRHKPRYVHIDQSTTTDSTGMSMVHIDDVREVDGVKKVFLNVDFMIRINPPKPPKEISIGKIRDFVFYMRDEMDVNIKKVSYDWFGSSESRQVLSEEGIEAEHFSVDKNDEAYLTLVRLLFEERIDLYKYDPFSNELFDLIHDRTKRKVDHPPGGHNDVSDSLAGAVMGALGDDSTESSGDNDAGIVAEVNRVDSPEDMFDMDDLMGDFF